MSLITWKYAIVPMGPVSWDHGTCIYTLQVCLASFNLNCAHPFKGGYYVLYLLYWHSQLAIFNPICMWWAFTSIKYMYNLVKKSKAFLSPSRNETQFFVKVKGSNGSDLSGQGPGSRGMCPPPTTSLKWVQYMPDIKGASLSSWLIWVETWAWSQQRLFIIVPFKQWKACTYP